MERGYEVESYWGLNYIMVGKKVVWYNELHNGGKKSLEGLNSALSQCCSGVVFV